MSEVIPKQLTLDLAGPAALLQQCESLEQTAIKSFTDLLARLKKNRALLSKLVEPKNQQQFVFKGIFIKSPDPAYEYLRLTDDAEFYNLTIRVHPLALVEKSSAVKCIEALISGIRKRIDAIKTQHESAQSAIAMAEAMLPD